MARLLNTYFNELEKTPSSFKDYKEYYKKGYKPQFEYYYGLQGVDWNGYVGAIARDIVDDFAPCYEDAIWFCTANYFDLLMLRVIGYTLNYKTMNLYRRECCIAEYEFGKGPISYPLTNLGLIPPKESEHFNRFYNTVKTMAEYHWKGLSSWIKKNCLDARLSEMKRLFFYNVNLLAEKIDPFNMTQGDPEFDLFLES